MKARATRILASVTRPMRASDNRIPLLERLLQCPLTPAEVAAIRRACVASGTGIGAFYHWRLEQIAAIAAVQALDRQAILALLRDSDQTNYSQLDAVAALPGGLLIATPHHGHFVFSIVAVCERLAATRPVYVFYEAPSAHATNLIFDLLHKRLYGSPKSDVTILHNTRQGLVRAMKELRTGAVVVILPDVFKDVHDTYQIPFAGGQRNVMLGSATIARRTRARILPMVARPTGRLLEFNNSFGTPFQAFDDGTSAVATTHDDFRTTLKLFRALEPMMTDQLLYWQYARGHVVVSERELNRTPLLTLAAMMLADPRVNVDLSRPLVVD